MKKLSFEVNGARRALTVDPDMPLLWLLREDLDLRGTKLGCGAGLCGACTVHLDGEPARACVVTCGDAAGRAVTTIEGLARGGRLHVVQEAWIAEDVAQCGYCQAGQIMTCAALLARSPRPTAEEVEARLAGHICRCGTYNRIRRAVRRALGELER
jgi:isoquinoline 1-oxidoreductase subunit alpha